MIRSDLLPDQIQPKYERCCFPSMVPHLEIHQVPVLLIDHRAGD